MIINFMRDGGYVWIKKAMKIDTGTPPACQRGALGEHNFNHKLLACEWKRADSNYCPIHIYMRLWHSKDSYYYRFFTEKYAK